MKKTLKRKIGIAIVFIVFGVVHFIGTRDWTVFIAAGVFGILTLAFENFIYAKRGVFLYALAGLIGGYYGGKIVYMLFAAILGNLISPRVEPYLSLMFAYMGFTLPLMASKFGYALGSPLASDGEKKSGDIKLLDTSVIIDGRIADIAETGFLSGTLILPKFVLNEIQALADSKDPIKRSRARRGLDVLNKLKEIQGLDLKIYSRDYPELRGVDAKLIALAKEMSGAIVTNDYNLNKVAKLDGIVILNLNDLSNALKPVLLPGEEFEIDVLREGKESNQGVGYLADGTMVVVANGLSLIGKRVGVKVTSILQTSAGRIIFTEPRR